MQNANYFSLFSLLLVVLLLFCRRKSTKTRGNTDEFVRFASTHRSGQFELIWIRFDLASVLLMRYIVVSTSGFRRNGRQLLYGALRENKCVCLIIFIRKKKKLIEIHENFAIFFFINIKHINSLFFLVKRIRATLGQIFKG